MVYSDLWRGHPHPRRRMHSSQPRLAAGSSSVSSCAASSWQPALPSAFLLVWRALGSALPIHACSACLATTICTLVPSNATTPAPSARPRRVCRHAVRIAVMVCHRPSGGPSRLGTSLPLVSRALPVTESRWAVGSSLCRVVRASGGTPSACSHLRSLALPANRSEPSDAPVAGITHCHTTGPPP